MRATLDILVNELSNSSVKIQALEQEIASISSEVASRAMAAAEAELKQRDRLDAVRAEFARRLEQTDVVMASLASQ